MSDALKANTTLTKLDLEGEGKKKQHEKDIYQQYILSFLTPKYTVNNIGDTGVKSLSEALMTNTTLTDIDLRGKHEGNQFVLIQNHHFFSNKTENIIGETGVASLSEALKINTALSILDLTCKHK